MGVIGDCTNGLLSKSVQLSQYGPKQPLLELSLFLIRFKSTFTDDSYVISQVTQPVSDSPNAISNTCTMAQCGPI